MSTYKCRLIPRIVYRMNRDRIQDLQIRQHIQSVEIADVEITSVDCNRYDRFTFLTHMCRAGFTDGIQIIAVLATF